MTKEYNHERVAHLIKELLVELGEDPAECARRELIEETGYRAEKFELLSSLS